MLVVLVPLLAFVTVLLVVWALSAPNTESTEARLRKHGYLPSARQVVDLQRPFSKRVVSPTVEGLGRLVARVTPLQLQQRTREKLEQADVGLTPSGFLLLTAAFSLVLPLVVVSPSLRAGNFGLREAFFGLVLFFMGTRLPDFWLSRKVTARQNKVRKALPDALDLITICVEAGYGLDAALAKVGEKTKGPLADEVSRALLEVNLGKPRSQALKDMAQRARVAELQSFIATIVQAEQMGVSIANVLRVQSDSMRVKRRQRAEELALKAPVKMLFPLVIFILPTMFMVILGPVALKIATVFMGRPLG